MWATSLSGTGAGGRAGLHQPQGLFVQRVQIELGQGLGVVEHRDVQPTGQQPFLHGDRQRLADREAGLRQLLAEGPRQRHRQHLGQAGRQADGDPTGQRTAHPTQFLARPFHLVQDAAAVFEQQLAGLGGRGAAPVAHQQGLAQFHLQQPHLARERGLGHVERDGRAGEAAEFGHAHKVFELLQIHDGLIIVICFCSSC
jgi:hypothetical protein